MSVHTVKLVRREPVAQSTMAFHFERPAGFAFKAGQAIDVVLPQVLDAAGKKERHAFSIVSAPFEDGIAIATRMRDSAYKRALAVLAPGAAVEMHGPFGSLTLHSDPGRPAVLVAGGIGITPFISMLRQVAHDRWPRPM
ncbi:MAG TPA: FAD-dependent oxidoreductase, partial [Burkholderiales bacterium]|nr:FAD-dependent oxidoreductase [Burkholderiales bacterium]